MYKNIDNYVRMKRIIFILYYYVLSSFGSCLLVKHTRVTRET